MIVRELITVLGFEVDKSKLKDAEAALDQFKSSAADAGGETAKLTDRTKTLSNHLSRAARVVVAFGAVRMFGRMIAEVGRTNMEYERHEAILTTLLGTQSASAAAFERIVNFATRTPFGIDEVTNAFTRLNIAFGDMPWEEMQGHLQGLGNVAAVMGHDIGDLVYAIQRASAGQTRRLSNILNTMVRKTSRGIQFTFRGQDFTFEGRDGQDALQAIFRGISTDLGGPEGLLGGGIDRIMSALPGQFGLVKQSIMNFYRDLGSGGLSRSMMDNLEILTRLFDRTIEGTDDVNEGVLSWRQNLGNLLSGPIRLLNTALSTIIFLVSGPSAAAWIALFELIYIGIGAKAIQFLIGGLVYIGAALKVVVAGALSWWGVLVLAAIAIQDIWMALTNNEANTATRKLLSFLTGSEFQAQQLIDKIRGLGSSIIDFFRSLYGLDFISPFAGFWDGLIPDFGIIDTVIEFFREFGSRVIPTIRGLRDRALEAIGITDNNLEGRTPLDTPAPMPLPSVEDMTEPRGSLWDSTREFFGNTSRKLMNMAFGLPPGINMDVIENIGHHPGTSSLGPNGGMNIQSIINIEKTNATPEDISDAVAEGIGRAAYKLSPQGVFQNTSTVATT